MDAHCDMDSSLAPAPTMTAKASKMVRDVKRSRREAVCSGGRGGMSGTRRNKNRLQSGKTAQTSGSRYQISLPNASRNRVESRTTPAWPQQ